MPEQDRCILISVDSTLSVASGVTQIQTSFGVLHLKIYTSSLSFDNLPPTQTLRSLDFSG